MRIEAPERFVPDFDVSNALTMAILLLGPALIAIGAARTAGTGAQER